MTDGAARNRSDEVVEVGEGDETPVIVAIVGTVLVAAAAGAAWIWRQARRHRRTPGPS